MNATLLFIWVVFGLIGAVIGQYALNRPGWGLMLGLLLGPIGCAMIPLFHDHRRRCPDCKSVIHPEAKVCPFCRSIIGRR